MKKKRLPKGMRLILIVAMVLGITACGKPQYIEESVTNPEAFKVTYPIQTNETFKFVTTDGGYHSNEVSSFDESPYHQNLKKLTGVDVEWEFSPGGSKLNRLLADERKRPVAFNNGWFSNIQVEDWKQAGMIIDLTDYLPTYAPDFWKLIHSPKYESTKHMITDNNGRFYYIPFLNENEYVSTYQGPCIRQDWLNECGLDIPVTLDELEIVLIAFKEKYGATLGGDFSIFSNTGAASGTGAYASLMAKLYIDDNGKVQCANVQPKWKALMEYYSRWYQLGLIDVEIFNTDYHMQRQKALDGDIGVIFIAQSQLTQIIHDSEDSGNGAEWVPIEYFRTAPGEPTSLIQTQTSLYANDGATFITDKCPEKLIPLILQWVNYGYTEEGIQFINFGIEGESYTRDEDGNIRWTELITEDPAGINAAMLKYCGAVAALPGVKTEQMVRMRNNKVAQVAVEKWIANTEVHDHLLPSLYLNWEENVIYADKWKKISSYINEYALKFLTGEVPLDEFDNYVGVLEIMGLQDVLDVQQAAYERFINHKNG